ncbi:MAG: hypothetical protein V1491_01160 [archaeon]
MQFKKKVTSSIIISSITLITSIILPIIPCRIAPSIPKPIYKWTLCNLNPDNITSLNSLKEFFGYTSSLTETYFITLIISFIASMIFFYFTTKKQKN